MRQLLSVFKNNIDGMTIEQKRAAIRTVIRKVVWDGVHAHLILFGVQDDEVDYPAIPGLTEENSTDKSPDGSEDVTDMDSEIGMSSKTHWGEDRK